MSADLPVEVEATFALQRASSDCCGAKLDGGPNAWTCRQCKKPCLRMLGEPTEVVARG